MAHAQKPDFVFQRNGRVHLNWREVQFSRLLAAEVCASAVVMVVMLDIPCSEVECKATGYPLHFPFISPTVRHRVPSGFNWTLILTVATLVTVTRIRRNRLEAASRSFDFQNSFPPIANLLRQPAVCALAPAPYSPVTQRNYMTFQRGKPYTLYYLWILTVLANWVIAGTALLWY